MRQKICQIVGSVNAKVYLASTKYEPLLSVSELNVRKRRKMKTKIQMTCLFKVLYPKNRKMLLGKGMILELGDCKFSAFSFFLPLFLLEFIISSFLVAFHTHLLGYCTQCTILPPYSFYTF